MVYYIGYKLGDAARREIKTLVQYVKIYYQINLVSNFHNASYIWANIYIARKSFSNNEIKITYTFLN